MKTILLEHIEKIVSKHDPKTGSSSNNHTTIINESVGKQFKYFTEVLKFVSERYDFPNETRNWGAIDDGRLTAVRFENDDGEEVTDPTQATYVADFDLIVTLIVTEDPAPDEMKKLWGVHTV